MDAKMKTCIICHEEKPPIKFDPRCHICKSCRGNFYASARAEEIRTTHSIAKKVKGWGFVP